MKARGKRISESLKRGFVFPLLFTGLPATCTSTATAQTPGAFTPTGSMTTVRMSHTATLLADGRVLIAGGHVFSDGKWSGTSSAELYDPSTKRFADRGHMTTTRLYQTATRLPDGKILIAGGMDTESHPLATAELYDPLTGTFTPTGGMTVARGASTQLSLPDGPTATLLPDSKVLITGGWDTDTHSVATGEIYDPDTGRFTATGEMTASPRAPTATLLADGRVLVANWSGSADLYDPSTRTFAATGHMTTVRLYPTATLLPDGKVLIAGGMDGESVPLTTAELFDPTTGTFTATGEMDPASGYPWNGRSLQTSTLLPDGTVLIAGGWPNPGNCWTSARLYDRLTGEFSATGGMATGRCLHTATLLNDGSVLIAGGIENEDYDSRIRQPAPQTPRVLDSAELYHPAVLVPSLALLSLSGDGRGQGAIQHADTYQLVSPGNPAAAGEAVVLYCTGLADGSVIPPQVAMDGHLAEVLWFGKTPGFVGLNQINVRVPSGIASGREVPVRLTYLGRTSNEVTIGLR